MAPLTGFRFLQVGTGPVDARTGTVLALLGAQVVVVTDGDGAAALLGDPTAPDHAGRLVLDPAAAASAVSAHGTIDGRGDAGVATGDAVVVTADRVGGGAGWAAAGAMGLTGRAGGPALAPAGDVATGLHAAAAVVELLSALGGRRMVLDGPALLGERAALTGATRRGATTVGGAGRLLRAADGWVAVSLPRPSDLDLLPAWLGLDPVTGDEPPWDAIAEVIAGRPARAAVSAAQELGVAAARVPDRGAADDEQLAWRGQGRPPAPFLLDGHAPRLAPARPVGAGRLPPLAERARPVAGRKVVDLSSLWAGPLATSILAAAGADVLKVESTERPDGARAGDARFFDLLDAGKSHARLDLGDPDGRARLGALCDGADLVVEASRPRALDQLGVGRRRPWLSITAYGRTGPWAEWVGFGDDAAAAGGLVSWDAEGPVFAADAVADPATGLFSAAAALATLVGAPADVDVALREVAAHLAGAAGDGAPAPGGLVAAPPRARALPPGTVRP